jgi:Secretion system C-terminal sorting domain
MKVKMNLFFMAFCLLTTGGAGIAQEHSVGAGGNASSSSGSVSYTIGQMDYVTTSGVEGQVSQGVQQPYEFFSISVEEADGIHLTMLVYPNPTNDYILLTIDQLQNMNLSFSLYDVQGKYLQQSSIQLESTQIPMFNYSPGIYFLTVYNHLNEIQSFKIIKN